MYLCNVVIIDTSNRLQTTVTRLLDMIGTQSTQLTSTHSTQNELVYQVQILRTECDQHQTQVQDLKGILQEVREEKQKATVDLNTAVGRWSGIWGEKILKFDLKLQLV